MHSVTYIAMRFEYDKMRIRIEEYQHGSAYCREEHMWSTVRSYL
jgi:hypothetical protein